MIERPRAGLRHAALAGAFLLAACGDARPASDVLSVDQAAEKIEVELPEMPVVPVTVPVGPEAAQASAAPPEAGPEAGPEAADRAPAPAQVPR